MENLKSKKYNYNEVIKMPSVEEQKELLESIVNNVRKELDFEGVSEEDYDSIPMFAQKAFEPMILERYHDYALIKEIVKNNFESAHGFTDHYFLLLEPLEFVLSNMLGYKYVCDEGRWIKTKVEKEKPSVEEQKELLKSILNYFSKRNSFVGISKEDYDSIPMYAQEVFKSMIEERYNDYALIKEIVESDFMLMRDNGTLVAQPLVFVITDILGYEFKWSESGGSWVKTKVEKSIDVTKLFQDVIILSVQKHYQHICSQIEKDYTECRGILSSDELNSIYLSNPDSIGNIKDNYIILKASNKEEAIKEAALQVADYIEDWMFEVFDLEKVQNKFFKSVSKINGYYIFEKRA